jgi:hypothetical protein
LIGMVGFRWSGVVRAAIAAPLCAFVAALWTAGHAEAQSQFRVVSLRVAEARATPPVRFVGSLRVHVPSAWRQIAQKEPNEPTFVVALSAECSAKLYLSTISAVTHLSAKRQLDQLRANSQPGIPVPGPIRVYGQGALPHRKGGWWRIVAPVGPEGFTLYGGVVAPLGDGRWVDVLAGLTREPNCPRPLPEEATVLHRLTQLLTSLDPTSVHVVRAH